MILGEHLEIDLARMRKAHVEMLCELLEPGTNMVPSAGNDAPRSRRTMR
ncbi:MAG: hypothetical protein WA210_02940 [Burkholderiaceae bacterium]